MPLYTQYCPKCNKIWELMIKLKDFNKVVECPDCGTELKRLLSPVRFKFN